MSTEKYTQYIEDNTIRVEASHRGGGIEIDLSDLLGIDGAKMTAYQNYLGGGMLGSIQNSYNFQDGLNEKQAATLTKISEELNRYFHDITNHAGDEYESASYEQGQRRPASAY